MNPLVSDETGSPHPHPPTPFSFLTPPPPPHFFFFFKNSILQYEISLYPL